MAMTVCMVPRWSGTGESDYLPWLRSALDDAGLSLRVAPLMPTPDAPTVDASVRSVAETVADLEPADILLIAHSVGTQVALRWLASLPAGASVRAFLAVAGWWTIDEPWPTIQPFLDEPFAIDRARAAAHRTHVLLGDVDPFTSDQQQNAATWREWMGAEVAIVEGRGHYNVETNPELLALIEAAADDGG